MNHTKMNLTCPFCGVGHNTSSHPTETKAPSPGDCSICVECHKVSIFDDDLSLRAPTKDEEEEIEFEPEILQMLMAAKAVNKVEGPKVYQVQVTCPYCKVDLGSGVSVLGTLPESGSPALCSSCKRSSKYLIEDGSPKLVALSPEEEKEFQIPDAILSMVDRVSALLKDLNKTETTKTGWYK